MVPTPTVAWTRAQLICRAVESPAIRPHRQSMPSASIVRRSRVTDVQNGAVRRQHNVLKVPSRRREAPPQMVPPSCPSSWDYHRHPYCIPRCPPTLGPHHKGVAYTKGVKQRILSYHMTPVTQVIGHRQQHCPAALQHCLFSNVFKAKSRQVTSLCPPHGRSLYKGASNGQVAVSAFGSGCACPTAVIAICPICQCSAEPQLEVCSAVHPSSLCPLAAFASWALQGYACIQVKGHSLPVVLL